MEDQAGEDNGNRGAELDQDVQTRPGLEDAEGSYDPTTNTLFFNEALLSSRAEEERLFVLFHELRHAQQYLQPERFDETIRYSRFYAIQFDGLCFRLDGNEWKSCRLPEAGRNFTALYLSQPL